MVLVGPASASPWDVYGQGGSRMGRAGGGMAIPENVDSIVANAAALAGMERGEVGLGFLAGDMKFLPFSPVYWDTNRDGTIDDEDTPLDIQPDYEAVRGFSVAITHPFGPKIAGGLAAYVPVQHLMTLQSFDPQLPTYFLYANRMQRYDFALELAARPIAGLAIGVGAQILPRAHFALDATLDATVSSADSASASDLLALSMDIHELSLEVVPGYAPNVSLHWDAGQVVPALQGLYLGAAWRGATGLPVDVDLKLQINAGTEQIGDIPPATLPLYLALQLGIFDHYQPSQLSLGAAYRLQDALTFSADVRRTAWDQMTVSVAKVTTATVNGALVDLSDLTVEDGNPYAITLAPTWSPRIGADLAFPAINGGKRAGEVRIVTRGGLGYEPSPLVSQTASSALLDADRLIFAVGAGVSHDDPLHPKGARRMHWDAFFQYHLLANGALDRGTPTTPTAGYSVDGSAVPIGGHLYAAGLTWRSEY